MTEANAEIGRIPFDNSYARLPERFYAKLPPTPVHAPGLVRVNRPLARSLGLDADYLASPAGLDILAGNQVPAGAEPLAMAYAGHQFGGWSPQLGDGRAILLGEVVDRDGIRNDIQLKGSGRTPFSRRGDGRAVLGPVLREYVISEAMHALGIPTTRSLAAVTTGELVMRERPLPGAVLTRVARSHVRIGTFQFFAARGDVDAIRILADHVIARQYPEMDNSENPYVALLEGLIVRQAKLVAQWMSIGFIHGVMNTDNMSIAGETIDYGPCAFMDSYHPNTVYSSIDEGGRYAFANQPAIAQWNLTRLAECLLSIIDETEEVARSAAQRAIDGFAQHFETEFAKAFGRKLGLGSPADGDMALIQDLLGLMAANRVDFTLTFRRLADMLEGDADALTKAGIADPAAFDAWIKRWHARLETSDRSHRETAIAMRSANPAIIARNHLVEKVIRAAEDEADFEPFAQLLEVVASPFDEPDDTETYTQPPKPEEVVHQTFCGT